MEIVIIIGHTYTSHSFPIAFQIFPPVMYPRQPRDDKFRPFMCLLCGKAFTFKHHLKRHDMVVHQGIYKHKCSHCGKPFRDSSDLRVHLIAHHSQAVIVEKTVAGVMENK